MKTAALILAAGRSSRYGSPKQLLEINGQNLVQRAATLAQSVFCNPIIVITGAYHQEITSCHFPNEVELHHNPNWEKGMGSSLAFGVNLLIKNHPNTEAAFILLPDQAMVSADTLQNLASLLKNTTDRIALCRHNDTPSPPSLFHRDLFPDLAQLSGDNGGKNIVKNNLHLAKFHQTPEVDYDIDRPEDWERFCEVS